MSIFNVERSGPTASDLAKGWLETANAQARDMLAKCYSDVQEFWYRNRDSEGNPSLIKSESSQEPTGEEMLIAMGTQAALFIGVAWAKVAGLVQADQQYGLGIIDYTKLLPPFEITFNNDGTLKELNPR